MTARPPRLTLFAALVLGIGVGGVAAAQQVVGHAPGLQAIGRYTLAGDKHFIHGYEPVDPDGAAQVVVEIPTGTSQKWETDKASGRLVWEVEDGAPRVVAYLGYPGNYGMIPRTLLPKNQGGDGDPLDVLVLGPAVPRGSVVPARVIGVLRMVDRGERDDKLIAVLADSCFGKVATLEELQKQFPGAAQIVETWFTNYKGPGKMQSRGYADADRAQAILDAAIEAYRVNEAAAEQSAVRR